MLAPVKRRTVVEEVARRIRDYIQREGLRPGDTLPPERALAAQLRVARSSVREALKLLQALGWVEIRPQQGILIAEPDLRPLQEVIWERVQRERASLREIWEMRRLLEVGILRWVAERATPEDWERLEQAVAAMEEAVQRGGLGLQADIAFHEALVEATHNRLFIALREMAAHFFEEIQRQSLLESIKVRQEVTRQHRRILEALRQGEVEEAERLMAEHLEGAVRRGIIPAHLEKRNENPRSGPSSRPGDTQEPRGLKEGEEP